MIELHKGSNKSTPITSDDEKLHNMASCMLSILDYLKLQDNCEDGDVDMLQANNETLSEMMFRKMKGYNIDLNKELGFTHLSPVKSEGDYKILKEHIDNPQEPNDNLKEVAKLYKDSKQQKNKER